MSKNKFYYLFMKVIAIESRRILQIFIEKTRQCLGEHGDDGVYPTLYKV